MRLRDYLAIPYLLEAQAIEIAPGDWTRRVAYPELPGCVAEATQIEEAIKQLEYRRVTLIVDMLRAGDKPPQPRTPLIDADPASLIADLGLGDEIAALLDKDESDVANDKRGDAHALSRR